MRLPVSIDAWVIECCLEPPAIGHQIDGSLVLIEQDQWGGCHAEQRVELAAVAQPLPEWDGGTLDTCPVRLEVDGATLYWEAPHPVAAGPLTVTGHVTIAQHGEVPDGFPGTVGTVGRIRLAATQLA